MMRTRIAVIRNSQTLRRKRMLTPTPRVSPSGVDGVSELTLQTLFDREETSLLRYAFALSGRREVAEEIVQEVFLQLHVRWNEVDSPRAWLFRSVRNRVFTHLRHHRRERSDQGTDDQSNAVESETPEALVQRWEVAGALREILDELDETDRTLVKLKYFEGLRYREISARTGLSVSNVGYRLHHILKGIAERLRPMGIDGTS
ncbi:MAG: sigma-70 family RNA polymerase sigma factor [Planctomycetota bacterium]